MFVESVVVVLVVDAIVLVVVVSVFLRICPFAFWGKCKPNTQYTNQAKLPGAVPGAQPCSEAPAACPRNSNVYVQPLPHALLVARRHGTTVLCSTSRTSTPRADLSPTSVLCITSRTLTCSKAPSAPRLARVNRATTLSHEVVWSSTQLFGFIVS